jgi:hypothetical protein
VNQGVASKTNLRGERENKGVATHKKTMGKGKEKGEDGGIRNIEGWTKRWEGGVELVKCGDSSWDYNKN